MPIHFTSLRARGGTILFALVAAACSKSARVAPDASTTPLDAPIATADSASETVVIHTNMERKKLGLDVLARSAQLMRAAQLQADQMAASLTMAHDLPRARYPTTDDRFRAVGYRFRASGENVAEGFPSAASVVAGWMTSPGHRANITSTHFTEMGAGVAAGKNGRRFWAEVFGAPR